MMDELLLQNTVCLTVLANNEQATGAHIQTVGNDAVRVAFAHDRFYAVVFYASWYRQYAAGLVDDQQVVVFIDGWNLQMLKT